MSSWEWFLVAETNAEVFVNAVVDVSLQPGEAASASPGKNLFVHVVSALTDADIVFGNLETVLSEKGSLAQKAVTLSVAPEGARWLRESSFSVLNLANNHIMDRGLVGLKDTLQGLGRHFAVAARPG